MQTHTTVTEFSHAHKEKGMSDRVILICSPEGFEAPAVRSSDYRAQSLTINSKVLLEKLPVLQISE
jgi:hypothetical protein